MLPMAISRPKWSCSKAIELQVERFGVGFDGSAGWPFSIYAADGADGNRTLAQALGPASQ